MPNPVTILVVEDEPLVREMMVMELEDAGFRVLAAEDGEAAMAMLAGAGPIDLLFTDIRLHSGPDGWAVARQARALRPAIKIIYATGYVPDMPQLVEGSRFFKKPYLPSVVIGAMAEMLAA